MNILVTGGAGFIGKHLVAALIRDGHTVRIIDNLRRGTFCGLREIAECIQGDIRDADAVADAVAGMEAVIHLAAQSNVMGSEADAEYTYSTNVTGTWNVVRACYEAQVRHVVFASSREVYGDPACVPVKEQAPLAPKNLYGASKAAGELLVTAGRTPSTILRLGNAFGPGDSGRVLPLWMAAARVGQPLVLYGGSQVLDFVPITTVVDAFRRALETGPFPGPINVATGQPVQLTELANRIVGTFDTTSRIVVAPPRGPEVTAFVADVSRMRTLLELEPPCDSLEGLGELW